MSRERPGECNICKHCPHGVCTHSAAAVVSYIQCPATRQYTYTHVYVHIYTCVYSLSLIVSCACARTRRASMNFSSRPEASPYFWPSSSSQSSSSPGFGFTVLSLGIFRFSSSCVILSRLSWRSAPRIVVSHARVGLYWREIYVLCALRSFCRGYTPTVKFILWYNGIGTCVYSSIRFFLYLYYIIKSLFVVNWIKQTFESMKILYYIFNHKLQNEWAKNLFLFITVWQRFVIFRN